MVRPPACASRVENSAVEDGNEDAERERQLRDGARSDVPKKKEEARRRRRTTKREKREVG